MDVVITLSDFSHWNIYNGASEGSGRSEKIWLMSEDGQIGLFKFPKFDPDSQQITSEHISEHLACQIGKVLGVAIANVDIGNYNGRVGSMSYLIINDGEFLIEGINFISRMYPGFDADRLFDNDNKKYYCMEHLFRSTRDIIQPSEWIEMMVFDFLIGNGDRHQSNWAILVRLVDTKKYGIEVQRCPLYDNGSSLCCYVNDTKLKQMFGKDEGSFNSLVDSKSRSIIRIEGESKTRPRHTEVVKHLLDIYPKETVSICERFLRNLTPQVINELLNQYQAELLNPLKNKLIQQFLNRKLQILSELVKEGVFNGERSK